MTKVRIFRYSDHLLTIHPSSPYTTDPAGSDLQSSSQRRRQMTWGVVYGLQAGMVGVGLLALYCALTTPTLLCLATLGVLYYLHTQERRKAAGTLPLKDKTVLVTGCDTGIWFLL